MRDLFKLRYSLDLDDNRICAVRTSITMRFPFCTGPFEACQRGWSYCSSGYSCSPNQDIMKPRHIDIVTKFQLLLRQQHLWASEGILISLSVQNLQNSRMMIVAFCRDGSSDAIILFLLRFPDVFLPSLRLKFCRNAVRLVVQLSRSIYIFGVETMQISRALMLLSI